jgi:hypothetical protein
MENAILIKSSSEIARYADKIVAYKSKSWYVTHGSKELHYGYIESTPDQYWIDEEKGNETAYGMRRLLKQGEMPGTCILLDLYIKMGLHMRLATKQELDEIRTYLKAGTMEFEYFLKAVEMWDGTNFIGVKRIACQ